MYVTINNKQYKVKEFYVQLMNSLVVGIGFGVTMFTLLYLTVHII